LILFWMEEWGAPGTLNVLPVEKIIHISAATHKRGAVESIGEVRT
jgi:hypothetical protein